MTFTEKRIQSLPTTNDQFVCRYNTADGEFATGSEWRSKAAYIEGEIAEISSGVFRVMSSSYTYERTDWGWPRVLNMRYSQGDVIQLDKGW